MGSPETCGEKVDAQWARAPSSAGPGGRSPAYLVERLEAEDEADWWRRAASAAASTSTSLRERGTLSAFRERASSSRPFRLSERPRRTSARELGAASGLSLCPGQRHLLPSQGASTVQRPPPQAQTPKLPRWQLVLGDTRLPVWKPCPWRGPPAQAPHPPRARLRRPRPTSGRPARSCRVAGLSALPWTLPEAGPASDAVAREGARQCRPRPDPRQTACRGTGWTPAAFPPLSPDAPPRSPRSSSRRRRFPAGRGPQALGGRVLAPCSPPVPWP